MFSFLLGTRSRRAAAFIVLCAWAAIAVHADRLFAQQIPRGAPYDRSVVVGEAPTQFRSQPTAGGAPKYQSSSPAPAYDPRYGSGVPVEVENPFRAQRLAAQPPCNDNAECWQDYGDCNDCVSDDCNGWCDFGHEPYHFSGWIGAEYLRWRLDGNRLPPLVTAGPANLPLDEVAQLDEPSTEILSGDETVNDGWRSGYRLYGGLWFDCCHTWGIGADWFELGDDDYNFLSPQDSSIVTGRPFFNTETGEDDLELVSVPNELDGTAEVRSSDGFQGGGVTLNRNFWCCCDPCCGSSGLTGLFGYRHYDYDTNLTITERLTVLPGTTSPLVPGTTFFVQDRFRTRNDFDGAEFGLQGYKGRGGWWLDGLAKVAMGRHRTTVIVDGVTITDVPGGGTAEEAGGLLTSEVTNIGRYSASDFVFIPEFRLGVGACVTQNISVRAGYNCILWNDVARAADHLPPGLEVDPRNLPPVQAGGGPEPEFPGIRGSTLVAHGLDASVTFEW